MVKVPKQLQNPEFNFVLLGKWDLWGRYKTDEKTKKQKLVETKTCSPSEYDNIDKKIWKSLGKAPYEGAWQKRGYVFNSSKLVKHNLNFGIIGGYGRLRVLDIDDKALGEALEEQVNTFTIKTGGGGKHFYFLSDYETNHVLINELGELRAKNYQVVCCPSRHPNGEPYAIHKDLPIREIPEKELMGIIGKYLKPDAKEPKEKFGFLGKKVKNIEVFKDIEKVITKGGLIIYDGSYKPYKIYHSTTNKPDTYSNLKFKGEKWEEATIKKVSVFSDKIVYALDNKKHITIAEGSNQKEVLTENKKEFEKLIGTKLFFGEEEFIEKVSSKEKSKEFEPGKDTSNSAFEYRRVIALLREGKDKESIYSAMQPYLKWNSSPEAYRELTYTKAKAFVDSEKKEEVAEEEDFEVFTDKDLIGYEPPEQEWLIENQIPKGEVGLLVGKRGHRKSFLAQVQAICGASQKAVFEDGVQKKFKILWIDEEMGKNEIAKRTKLLKQGLGITDALDIKYISRTGLKLDKKDTPKFLKFKELFLEYKPDLCVVDCLQRVVSFEVDKDNASISELFTGTVRPLINKTGCTFYFIHHLRKSPTGNFRPEDPLDEVRGGSELVNYCRFVLSVQTPKYQTQTSEGGEMIVFRALKMSNAQMPEPKVISFTTTEEGLLVKYEGLPEDVLAGEVQASKAIKDFLFSEQMTGEFRTKDVLDNSEKIGFKRTLLSAGLNCLVKEGFIKKVKRGLYQVNSKVEPKQETLTPKKKGSGNKNLDELSDKELEELEDFS